jgi:hypothetical protein
MLAWFTGIKLKLIEFGAAALALLIAIATIFGKGKKAGEAKVQAQAAREQAKTVEIAKEVHEDVQSRPASEIGAALKNKYSRND